MAIHEWVRLEWGRPRKSVLNASNTDSHVKNLLVWTGRSFVSSACQNPTLTMMAVTVRACDQLSDRFRKKEI